MTDNRRYDRHKSILRDGTLAQQCTNKNLQIPETSFDVLSEYIPTMSRV